MKNINLLLIATITCSSLSAQITLTSDVATPSIGNANEYLVENFSIDVSNSGENQTWDFSSVGTDAVLIERALLAPSEAEFLEVDPEASYTVHTENNDEIFEASFSTSTDGIRRVSLYSEAFGQVIFTDPQEIIRFPLSYNSEEYNDTFSATFSEDNVREGTIKTYADAYGTLILPNGTVHNVLRAVSEIEYTVGITAGTKETAYMWFDGFHKEPIAVLSVITVPVGEPSEIKKLRYTTANDLNINEIKQSHPFIYPNPTQNSFSLNSDDEIQKIRIIDVKGKTLKSIERLEKNQTINISNLNKGIYFVTFETSNNKQVRKKLIVTK
jgi:hypothetical protein